MGIQQQIGTVSMPAVAAILSRFNRDQLHGFIAVAIDLADALDGDPDIEPDGDETDGSMGEDDFVGHNVPLSLQGPGCPSADCGEEDDPQGECSEDEISCGGMVYGWDRHRGPGCLISDPDGNPGTEC
ncbi:MAG: hypothetical protein KKD08_10330 [Alphaproteobacteria bacterium]|jgi:hypothetical protein|nr:hypothetical protein [Alphaproteobacteria bacterium]